jgi:hypothetical protein
MNEAVKISFEGAIEDEPPFVVIYNPRVMPAALYSQVQRFGLVGATEKKPSLSGKLKGTRKAFTEMIQSYGVRIDLVRVPLEPSASTSKGAG